MRMRFVFLCGRVCMCVCVRVCVCVCRGGDTCTDRYQHVCMCTYAHAPMNARVCMCRDVWECEHVPQARAHACTHFSLARSLSLSSARTHTLSYTLTHALANTQCARGSGGPKQPSRGAATHPIRALCAHSSAARHVPSRLELSCVTSRPPFRG